MAREFGFEPVTAPPYYFISYNSQDAARVSAICRELHSRGVPMWYDKGLLSGEKWERQITLQVKNCHEMILFVTKNLMARENPYVYKEFVFARQFNKKIHIVMLDEIRFEDVSDDLKGWFVDMKALQGVFVSDVSAPAEAADAMERLIGFVKKPEPVASPPPAKKTEPAMEKKPTKAEPPAKQTKKAKSGKKIDGTGWAIVICAVCAPIFWLFFTTIMPEYVRDDPSHYTYEYVAETDSYTINGLADSGYILRIPRKINGKPVTKIDEGAFKNYDGLKTVRVPSTVTEIGDSAFEGCSKLDEITLPSSVTSIGDSTFKGCYSLKKITIPSSVAIISDAAFQDCNSLEKITIPSSVTSIILSAFDRCPGLVSINVDQGNQTYLSELGVLYNKDKTKLLFCPRGKSGRFKVPSSVRSIGDSAFEECVNLDKITVPPTVTSIGVSAFEGCYDLTICGKSESYAEKYAEENFISFEVE